MALIRHIALILLVLQLVACAGARPFGEIFEPDVYTVRRGDTVYSIAWRYRLNHRDLLRWNRLQPPYSIFPGQRLRLSAPEDETDPALQIGVKTDPATQPAITPEGPKAPEASDERPPAVRPTEWGWPSDAALRQGFRPGDPARQGLDFSGEEGQVVRAAAAGLVVYSGNGLPAYGNLIIVRHDEIYLSAYAHNRELLVAEGDRVQQGQAIASMGLADNRQASLHFEIRKNGEPVDPMKLLPPR